MRLNRTISFKIFFLAVFFLNAGCTQNNFATQAYASGASVWPMRGVTLAAEGYNFYNDKDYADLGAMNVNLVRVFLRLDRCSTCTSYDFPEQGTNYVEQILENGARYGFKVVVVLEPLPAYAKSDYWNNESLLQSIAERWKEIAARLKSYPALEGYDILNEPVPPHSITNNPTVAMQKQMWRQFAIKLIESIRQADQEHVLFFEPAPWAFPDSFTNLEPLPYPNIVYSFHLYQPHEVTHQGLPNEAQIGTQYPNDAWNKARLSQVLQPVRDFVRKTGAKIYVGEVSAIRWAPNGSATRYVQDAIELIEAEHWSWTYHCWRAFQGWDAEIPYDLPVNMRKGIMPSARDPQAPTMRLLRSYFAQNRK